jgi:hypothetical protein
MKRLLFPLAILILVAAVLVIRSYSLGSESVSISFTGTNSSVVSEIGDLQFSNVGCELSLHLKNEMDAPLVLWEPYCPEGDQAFWLEFKKHETSNDVGKARTCHMYTGGMGIAKTFTLQPGESFVQLYDLSSYWALPFDLADGESTTAWARAVYQSNRAAGRGRYAPENASEVWEGKIATEWRQIKISNTSGSHVGNKALSVF